MLWQELPPVVADSVTNGRRRLPSPIVQRWRRLLSPIVNNTHVDKM